MAKRSRITTDSRIAKKIKEGQGRGQGVEYKPWVTVQDVPSLGTSIRVKGWKTGRIHHLLSRGEFYFFLWLEWLLCVLDIREQYPLHQQTTLQIADKLGISHPRDPRTQNPIVMTTDFYLTTQRGGETLNVARTFKNTADLKKKRTVEKLEIERLYWQEIRHTDWAITTEKVLPMALVKNVERIHDHFHSDGFDLSQDQLHAVKQLLSEMVKQTDMELRHITTKADRSLGLEPGTSLSIAYHLIATRQWIIDMNTPIDPGQSLNVTEFNLKD